MKRRKTSATRNVIVFGIMIAVLAVLTVLARPTLMMPPEPPELAAKRAAPENAYPVLMEAKALLSTPPPFLQPFPYNPAKSVPYAKEQDLLSYLSWNSPDEDLKSIYIAACAPAVAKAREALRQPYFLAPCDWTKQIEWGERITYSGVPPDDIHPVLHVVFVVGIAQTRKSDTEVEGFACLLDVARLGLLVARDPSNFHGGSQIFRYSLGRIGKSANTHTLSLQVLCDTLAALCKLQAELPDPATQLEYLWRRMDNIQFHLQLRYKSLRAVSESLQFFRALRREKREVIKNRDAFLEIARLPFSEYVAWSRQRPAPMTDGPIASIGDSVTYRTQMETSLNAAILIIAIEIYHIEHGVYPDTLDALTPDPLEMLPMDPFRGGKDTPFHYRREGDDYVLYSVGFDLLDDGGRGRTLKDARPKDRGGAPRTYDLVFHAPAASKSARPAK